MKNIYIFGNDSFKKTIKELLFKNEIEAYEVINSSEMLMDIIKTNQHECFLIDAEKTFTKSFIHKFIKRLIPKNSIEKSFLEQYGIGNLEFDSSKKAIEYIRFRYFHNDENEDEKEDILENVIKEEENPSVEFDENEIKDLAKITKIDEIDASDLDNLLLDTKKDKG